MRIVLISIAAFTASCSPAAKTAHDYRNHCAAGFAKAERLSAALQGGEPSLADPSVLSAGPPRRIQCAYVDKGGQIGQVTLDLICENAMEPDCVKVVSAITPSGRIAYVTRE